jgi:hypothetical protein
MAHRLCCALLLAVCTAWAAAQPAGAPTAESRKKFPGTTPSLGGGPVKSSQAVAYDADTLKARGVPKVTTDNKNTLIRKYPGKLLLSASSVWQGWPEALAFDDNPNSSWFSAAGDAVACGTKPWLRVTFPEDVTVRRVTILGSRDPAWPQDYGIIAGRIELFDAAGKVVAKDENDGTGKVFDYDWRLKEPVAQVRTVRFTSLGDHGKANGYDDVAVGEFQVE